jgi:hypothetical protein
MIEGLESVKIEIEKEEVINVERLKAAVEEKKSRMEQFKGKFFASGAKLEDVLPALESATFVNIRGTMDSPLMARAVAQAA